MPGWFDSPHSAPDMFTPSSSMAAIAMGALMSSESARKEQSLDVRDVNRERVNIAMRDTSRWIGAECN